LNPPAEPRLRRHYNCAPVTRRWCRNHVAHLTDLGFQQSRLCADPSVVEKHRNSLILAQPGFYHRQIFSIPQIRTERFDYPPRLARDPLAQLLQSIHIARDEQQRFAPPSPRQNAESSANRSRPKKINLCWPIAPPFNHL
jgi:hypothetical protein